MGKRKIKYDRYGKPLISQNELKKSFLASSKQIYVDRVRTGVLEVYNFIGPLPLEIPIPKNDNLINFANINHHFGYEDYDPHYDYDPKFITKSLLNYTEVEEILPFAGYENKVTVNSKTEMIFEIHDKICMAFYDTNSVKKLFTHYYKDERRNITLTLNLKTGNIYFSDKPSVLRASKNPFNRLKEKINSIWKEETANLFKIEIINRCNLEHCDDLSLFEVIVIWFTRFHKIKTTDNFINKFTRIYPTLRNLKKHKMNLTDFYMDLFKFHGKQVKKIINTQDDIDFLSLKLIHSILDIDIFNKNIDEIKNRIKYKKFTLNNNDPNVFTMSTYKIPTYNGKFLVKTHFPEEYVIFNSYKGILSVSEQNKVLKIFSFVEITQIVDHIKMKIFIKSKSDFNFKFTFRNIEEFDQEHELLSQIERDLLNKEITIIHYDSELIDFTETPIIVNDNKYDCRLLSNSDDYLNEGRYQKHCVGGYIKSKSHIVSVRHNYIRMTCEFSNEGKLIQSKMKHNKLPDEDWITVRDNLTNKIVEAHKLELLKPKTFTTKIKTKEEIFHKILEHNLVSEEMD